jgi:hypothetical protein
MVDELNRKTRAFSDTCIISQTAETRPVWFETDEEPYDSWEKQHSRETGLPKSLRALPK